MRASSSSIGLASARNRQSASQTTSTGASSAANSLMECIPQRYCAARKSTSRSIADTQAFGADRLRRRAQLSQSVALAASCAPQLPQSE
jgi:hypothetical protein